MGKDNIVYHYCSTDVFTKIISGKAIRLSDITKSNDSMEILWITKYLRDIFLEEFDKEVSATQYFADGYPRKLFSELVDLYTYEFFRTDERMFSFMVCCFSEVGDLLSQWRGYADDATGFSIGFDADTFNKYCSSFDVPYYSFRKVIYSEDKQKKQVRSYAKNLISKLKQLAKKAEKSIEEESSEAFYVCFLNLFIMSINMKNPFFKEEKEWRLCYWNSLGSGTKLAINLIGSDLTVSDVKYYSRRNDVVPYIDLFFNSIEPSIIKDVVIGPKNRTSKKDIEDYLKNNGIVCNVRKSAGTYR